MLACTSRAGGVDIAVDVELQGDVGRCPEELVEVI